jgi:ribosomal protein S18 acetylase RimI-like enzyme
VTAASLPAALAEAHDANYADFSTSYARGRGSHLHRDDRFDRAIVDLPALAYNGVFRSRLQSAEVATVASQTLELGVTRGVPVAWRVTPTTPPSTSEALDAAGWRTARRTPIMAIDLYGGPPPIAPHNVAVEEVTGASLGDWSRVVAVAFGCPEEYVHGPAAYDRDVGLPGETPLRRFLARVDGEPVAASALLPGPAGSGVAGVFCVGTLEASRGRGLGSFMTTVAMQAAAAVGATVAVLQASDLGIGVYRRLGFETVGHIDVRLPD